VRAPESRRHAFSAGAATATLAAAVALAGCGARETTRSPASRASALVFAPAVAADTFINSGFPDNNNGQSGSIFTGRTGMGTIMRGLIKFDLTAAPQGLAVVTDVRLTLTTEGLSANGTSPPTAATESLQAVTVDWSEGSGVGDAPSTFTVGQPCGTSGATWNQPDCAGGANWAGGTVAAVASGEASVPAAIGAKVTWDSAASGNAGLIADVQGWIDHPETNHGWRIESSTEGSPSAAAQRFTSAQGDATSGPTLAVTYAVDGGDASVTDADDAAMDGAGGGQGAGGNAGGDAGGGDAGDAAAGTGGSNAGQAVVAQAVVAQAVVAQAVVAQAVVAQAAPRRPVMAAPAVPRALGASRAADLAADATSRDPHARSPNCSRRSRSVRWRSAVHAAAVRGWAQNRPKSSNPEPVRATRAGVCGTRNQRTVPAMAATAPANPIESPTATRLVLYSEQTCGPQLGWSVAAR
jgi:hypothetical protein